MLVFNYAVTTDTENPQLFPNSSPGTYEGQWGGKFTVKARNVGTNTIWYGPAGSAIGSTAGAMGHVIPTGTFAVTWSSSNIATITCAA